MGAGKCVSGLACFLQAACATAIIVIVAMKLNTVQVSIDGSYNPHTEYKCYLGTSEDLPNPSWNLCYAAFAISGVSLLATLALGILLCCTCDLCGFGFIIETIFAAAGTAAWALAVYVLNKSRPASASMEQPQYRNIVFYLTCAACGLFGLMLLANLFSAFATCCRCCGFAPRSRRGGQYDQGAPKPVIVHHHHPPAQFIQNDTSGYVPQGRRY